MPPKPPVMLVHGCGSSWVVWRDWNVSQASVRWVDGGQSQIGAAGWLLREASGAFPRSAKVFVLDWQANISTIEDLAEAVGQAAQAVIRETGEPEVAIISHSLGGIISRYYIQSPGFQNDVCALYTIACPHNGAAAFDLPGLGDVAEWAYVDLIGGCRHAREILPDGQVIQFLRSNPMPDIFYASVAGNACKAFVVVGGRYDGTFYVTDCLIREAPDVSKHTEIVINAQHNAPGGPGNPACKNNPWVVSEAVQRLETLYNVNFP